MRKGLAMLLAVFIATALTLIGTLGGSVAVGASVKAPITILWVGDTTGPVKTYGDLELAGVEGAADYFNSHGGIDGHHVEVHAVSDNGDPTVAATVLTQQLSSSTPTMVWAGSDSTDSAAMIPILARYHVFAITLVDGQAQCATNAAVMCPNEWSLADPTSIAQQGIVNWIKHKHFKKVGVLEETTPFSVTETPPFLADAAAAGLTATTATFPPTALDLTPELQTLQAAGDQVVYAEGIGSAQYALNGRADISWDVPVIFDAPASSLDLTKLTTPPNLARAFEDTLYEEDSQLPDPGLAAMIARASRYADVTALPLSATSNGWDAVVALNDAVHRAGGSLEVGKLDAAMLKLPPVDVLRTISHKLGWTRNDHENVLGAPSDYAVFPVGPLVNGRVQTS